MEFGFDVLQTARGNYATQSYHDYIGFKVDTAVLSRAFFKTYGLDINEIFGHHLELAVESFRWTVKNIFPIITKTAWASKKDDILKEHSTATSKQFTFKMNRKQYRNEFGKGYKRPGFLPTVYSILFYLIPKVGPFKALHFKVPTPAAEKLFIQSFDTVLVHFNGYLSQLGNRNIKLEDIDFDTGKPTTECEYVLADETYDNWLLKLESLHFGAVSNLLKQNVLEFYGSKAAGPGTSKQCSKVYSALTALKSFQVHGSTVVGN